MKYFVHVGYDPEPKEVEDAVQAIALAEKLLKQVNDSEELSVLWRRDDLYPDNFLGYMSDELIQHLNQEGEVVLQLAATDADGLPIMGEIANIFTAFQEQKNTQKADQALEVLGKSLAANYKTPVTLTSAGQSKTFAPSGAVTLTDRANANSGPTLRHKASKPKTKKVAASKKKTTMKAKAVKRRTNPIKKKKK